jgi:hypothetical protein
MKIIKLTIDAAEISSQINDRVSAEYFVVVRASYVSTQISRVVSLCNNTVLSSMIRETITMLW